MTATDPRTAPAAKPAARQRRRKEREKEALAAQPGGDGPRMTKHDIS